MAMHWEAFFDYEASTYEQNGFTKNTVAEVDFFLSLFALPAGSSVLDMGCGTGRHSIELSKRGYRVVGVDRSTEMLKQARQSANEAKVDVQFVQADATTWRSEIPFDAAICLCEGGFGLIEEGEDAEVHDGAILANIAASIKPNAPFLLTALNAYQIIRQMNDQHVADGRFNPATMVANYEDQMDIPAGPVIVKIYERLFIPPEVKKMLEANGFIVDNIWGGTAGHWAQRPLSLDEIEAMYVCRKRS